MNPAWALLRLASPQLPIGGYSYSQGLEMAVDNGRVSDPSTARRWISDQLLLNLARFEAPLLLAHCSAAASEDWPQLWRLCEQHRASRETRELHQESRQMGYSLQQLLSGLPELDPPAREFLQRCHEPHLALGWALAARAWHISAQDALAAWLASLDSSIPLHLSRCFPRYHASFPPTPRDTMEKLRDIAEKHLSYVYLGNM